ncbi:MAG: hypothetical protein QOH95_2867 [Gaiellaceae bacterium]|nr:hypothetical protein [Gaiellaceae bacterium]
MTNPDWRVEIWHAGSKAAEIRNDKWHLVLADLAQFAATRAEYAELELVPDPPEAEVEPGASEPEAAREDAPEAAADADSESASMYWAHFAAAALQRKQVSPESAATMADQMLAEYGKRFPEAA